LRKLFGNVVGPSKDMGWAGVISTEGEAAAAEGVDEGAAP
jgi:hypothetical protein